jgi:ribose transport system permease protein
MATLAAASNAPDQPHKRSWLEVLSQVWTWLFLLIICIFFAWRNPVFMQWNNLQNILAGMAILAIIAFGQTFVIISGGIDLSVGWIMGMVTVVAAMTMNRLPPELPLWLVLLIGSALGLLVAWVAGLVNGLLVAYLGVPPFIATLGMFGIARGVGFLFSGGMPVPARVQGLGFLGNGYVAYHHPEVGWSFFRPLVGLTSQQMREVNAFIPFVVIVMLVVLVIAHYVLSRTRFGLHTYAIGGNKEAALRAGIPVSKRLVFIYLLSATFAAISAIVYVTRFTNGAANAGESLVLDTVAAVVIGGASLFGGSGTLIGTLIGALIIAVLNNGLVIINVQPFWQFIAVGVVIIVAVLIDQARVKLTQ